MPTPQKLAISISDSQLDLETEIDPDWERLIGSPRFEAARQRCGLLLSDLQTERAARPGADEVQQAVAARKERRRKLEVRAVLQARQADAEKPESPTLGVGSAEWVAMMRKKNEEEVEVLRQKVRTANEVQKRRTTQEIVSRIADAARADQMKEAQAVREAAAAAREEARQKEVKKKQEALARQRVQMEAERAAAVERQEELLVRRLFAQRQQEEAWRQQVRNPSQFAAQFSAQFSDSACHHAAARGEADRAEEGGGGAREGAPRRARGAPEARGGEGGGGAEGSDRPAAEEGGARQPVGGEGEGEAGAQCPAQFGAIL